jgi:hypothetical protein
VTSARAAASCELKSKTSADWARPGKKRASQTEAVSLLAATNRPLAISKLMAAPGALRKCRTPTTAPGDLKCTPNGQNEGAKPTLDQRTLHGSVGSLAEIIAGAARVASLDLNAENVVDSVFCSSYCGNHFGFDRCGQVCHPRNWSSNACLNAVRWTPTAAWRTPDVGAALRDCHGTLRRHREKETPRWPSRWCSAT